ncbi:MAG: bifunctional folylpolyglutamate synthase/dihydrofolate synthase [Acidobacteria bacterium]|nr:bifunctional folylpolyglutamate synthase/dihydrofolate synthase [Acidobacteriota bacterium]
MNFSEATQYLLSLGNEVEAMKLGLENISTLLAALDDPQTKYLKVQVAGTNGKGSVCAFLDSICREAGIRTGLYTSPHLISITERIKINGVDISEADFARFATTVREKAEALLSKGKMQYRPTFFEQITAIGLLAFADAGVELAILETGLGGRFDAVTAAKAEIAAITQISLDHQEYLGNTIEEIASEKAAIIHAGSKAVVIGKQNNVQVLDIIFERCRSVGLGKRDIICPDVGENFPWGKYDLGLLGDHQVENSNIALLLAKALQRTFDITDDNISAGLANARHHGRLEYIGNFLFDGAHNAAGANALRAYLDEFEKRSITLIFGAMKDKNVREIASIIFPVAADIILTQPDNSRAMSVASLNKVVPDGFKRNRVRLIADIADAVNAAKTLAGENGLILVTGSLYLVGEVKKLLNNQNIDR